MTLNTPSQLAIIRKKDAAALCGVSISQLENWTDPNSEFYRPDFPKKIKLGNRRNSPVGFLSTELNAFIQSLADNRA